MPVVRYEVICRSDPMFTIKDIQKEFDPLLSSQARIALLTGFPDHLDLYTVRSLASDLQKRVQILFLMILNHLNRILKDYIPIKLRHIYWR